MISFLNKLDGLRPIVSYPIEIRSESFNLLSETHHLEINNVVDVFPVFSFCFLLMSLKVPTVFSNLLGIELERSSTNKLTELSVCEEVRATMKQ